MRVGAGSWQHIAKCTPPRPGRSARRPTRPPAARADVASGCLPHGGFWACPGGGIEDGELPEDALRRELAEEVGLVEPVIGGALWSLTRMFEMPGWHGQADTWFLVRTVHFEPQPRVVLVDENIHGVRWFTREELRQAVVPFSPRDLAAQVDVVLAHGVPHAPRVIDCLP